MSKNLHFDLIARCEMPYNIYKKLKDEEYFDEIKLLMLRDVSIDYSDNKEWIEANKILKEAYICRKQIEEQIRVEKHLK